MKKLKLTIKERVLISDILPQQGSKLQQIIVRGITRKTEFNSVEIDEYGLKWSGQGIGWNEKAKSSEFEFEVSESELSVLKESASLIDKENRVTQHNLSLLEKIESL